MKNINVAVQIDQAYCYYPPINNKTETFINNDGLELCYRENYDPLSIHNSIIEQLNEFIIRWENMEKYPYIRNKNIILEDLRKLLVELKPTDINEIELNYILTEIREYEVEEDY